ncbi:MAG: class B sortase [bacterium]
MDKVLVQVKKNVIHLRRRVKLNEEQKNLLNTNIISENELVFSYDYIRKNQKIIISFLKGLCRNQNIDTVYIYNTTITLELLTIIKEIEDIEHIVIKDDFLITHQMCEIMKQSKNIKTISAYSLHDFLTEYLDQHGKYVEVRKEIFLLSNFAKGNELNKYSSLIYKKNLNLTFPFNEDDKADFKSFIQTNKYLNTIHINKCDKSNLEDVIQLILLHKKKNIRIILHENVFEESLVKYIQSINSAHKKRDNVYITVSYSDSYLRNNMLAQTNLNILKSSMLLILLLVFSTFSYYIYSNYNDYSTDVVLKEVIEEVLLNVDSTVVLEKIKVIEKEAEKVVINDYIVNLQTINEDILGWINVPGTYIDYPIVQGTDNVYYLDYTIENNYTRVGSIFMNYNNNIDFTDDNTIIFGHNFSGSSVMFSTLNNLTTSAWQSDPSNRIISVDTLFENLEYEIFSYYTIPVTTDYLVPNYSHPFIRYDFYDMITQRSDYDFGITLTNDDKIITLSTCTDSGPKRFVVHAVLRD